jgi:uncharacterized protein
MKDTVPSFSAMLRETLSEYLAPNATTFVEMFAQDGVMEFPFAPPGVPQRVEGRPALAAHLEYFASLVDFTGVSAVHATETAEPGGFVIEFAGHGRSVANGEPYEQRYVSLVKVRDGHITHYKDYWNPIAILSTLKGQAFVESVFAS